MNHVDVLRKLDTVDDLRLRHMRILAVIAEQPYGRGTVGELASRIDILPSMLSRASVKLADLGYLKRLVNDGDQRSTILEITPAGLKFNRKLMGILK